MRVKSFRSMILIVIFGSTGCNGTGSVTYLAPRSSATPTPTATSTSITPASGPKAAKIIFSLSSSGSFDSTSTISNGTAPAPGSGFKISRVFNPDGSLLATQSFDSNGLVTKSKSWPNWLESFEIGLSGDNNPSAFNRECAKFADNSEILSQNCDLGGVSKANCGAPPGQFRVSETDCTLYGSPASAGNGGPSDGIYIRAVFNRSSLYLASNENILVVLEYAASALSPAPENPSDCYSSSSGAFSPERCSDFTWKAFVKTSPSSVVQPFLLLIPPTYSSVLVGKLPKQSGSTLTARQFIIPLTAFAADASSTTTLQISRINSHFTVDPLPYCTATGSLPGNSPLCAGVVFYSISLYRI